MIINKSKPHSFQNIRIVQEMPFTINIHLLDILETFGTILVFFFLKKKNNFQKKL